MSNSEYRGYRLTPDWPPSRLIWQLAEAVGRVIDPKLADFNARLEAMERRVEAMERRRAR